MKGPWRLPRQQGVVGDPTSAADRWCCRYGAAWSRARRAWAGRFISSLERRPQSAPRPSSVFRRRHLSPAAMRYVEDGRGQSRLRGSAVYLGPLPCEDCRGVRRGFPATGRLIAWRSERPFPRPNNRFCTALRLAAVVVMGKESREILGRAKAWGGFKNVRGSVHPQLVWPSGAGRVLAARGDRRRGRRRDRRAHVLKLMVDLGRSSHRAAAMLVQS